MLTSNFKTLGELKLEEVQFITAIALDNLGEYKAAKVTLNLFAKERETDSGGKPSELLDKEIKESGVGTVKGFLEALYNKELIQIRSSNVYNRFTQKRISSLFEHITKQDLYNHVMKLIASYNKNDYLVLYMKTQMWSDTFRPLAVSKRVSVSDEVVERLYNFFIEFVSKYSSDGKYDMKTRTPNAFLMKTYNNYVKGKKAYFDIVNSKSIMSATSDEDARSMLDKYSDDDRYDVSESNYSKSEPIDFMDIAEKIYKASYCLYNHGADKGIAYSDLLTWYKEYASASLKAQNNTALSLLNKVYQINYADNTDGLCQEATVKCRIRNKTCQFMFNRMRDGITIYDIYPLFEEVAAFSTQMSNGNSGTPLFTYGGITAKKGTNQYKFQSIYEGFCALKELIAFLASPQNTTGVDIFNFPVQIFRDKRLLNRFHSLRDYILLYEDVISLIHEIDINPERQTEYNDTSLFSNEVIYSKMLELSTKNSDIDALLNKARDINLAKSASLLTESKTELFKNNVEEPINDFVNKLATDGSNIFVYQNYNTVATSLTNKSGQYVLVATIKWLLSCYAVLKNEKSTDIRLKNAALSIISLIDIMCEKLGEPIDTDGISNISKMSIEDILDKCGIPKGVNDIPIDGVTRKIDCFNFIATLYKAALQILGIDKLELQPSELPFNVARLLNGVISELDLCRNQLVNEIRSANEKKEELSKMFLSYAKMLNKFSIINLNYPIKEIAFLIPYLEKAYVVDLNQLDYMDYNEAMFERHRLAEDILRLINDYLQYYEQLFLIFREFFGFAKDTLKVVGNASGVSQDKHRMMTMLSSRIKAELSKSTNANELERISQQFNCHYDNNHYLMKHRNYITLDDGRYYVHEDGYKVLPGVADEVWIVNVNSEIQPLTLQDIYNIEIDLRGR